MSIHVALAHRTTYRCNPLVSLGPQTIRLRPAPHGRAPILAYSLKVEPKPHVFNCVQDPQGTVLARVVIPNARAISAFWLISSPTWRPSTRSMSSSNRTPRISLRLRSDSRPGAGAVPQAAACRPAALGVPCHDPARTPARRGVSREHPRTLDWRRF
jgi:transglutaminase-like putative cysteine protease